MILDDLPNIKDTVSVTGATNIVGDMSYIINIIINDDMSNIRNRVCISRRHNHKEPRS